MKNIIFIFCLVYITSASLLLAASSPLLPKGYDKWLKSERKVVTDKSSLFYGIHYIYADVKAQRGYKADNKFSEGSRIVVEFFNIKDNPSVDGSKNMVVMMQKDKGQKTTGGWRFLSFGADGKPSGLDPLTTCFSCHFKDASQRDFVISTKKDFKLL